MELFIPSLIVLLLSAIFCLFVLPKLSPYVLGMLALAMFGIGIWQHYSMFPYEYRTSSLTDKMREYSGFVMLIALIFAGIFAILFIHGGNPPAATDIMPTMPALPTVFSNNSKSIFNLSGNSGNSGIMGAVENMSKSVTNAFKPANSKTNFLASPSFKIT